MALNVCTFLPLLGLNLRYHWRRPSDVLPSTTSSEYSIWERSEACLHSSLHSLWIKHACHTSLGEREKQPAGLFSKEPLHFSLLSSECFAFPFSECSLKSDHWCVISLQLDSCSVYMSLRDISDVDYMVVAWAAQFSLRLRAPPTHL